MAGFNVTDPDTTAAARRTPDFNADEHPYLRRLTPEQQHAYARHLLARRGPPQADDTGRNAGGA